MANNYERPKDDFYSTPKFVVDGLFEFVDLKSLAEKGHNFFEPCKGIGGIYNYLPEPKDYCTLEEDKDYLKMNFCFDPKKVIVTNPPFILAKEFLEKSLSESPVVIYFLRLNFLGSGGRFDFFKQNPPDHFIISSDRPSFTPDGKTDNCDYAWMIWDKDSVLGLTQASYFFEDPIRAARRKVRDEKKLDVSLQTNLKSF